MQSLLMQMLLNNETINNKLGQPLNVVELLHTTSINGLNSIRLSLAKQIENLENADEWVASPVSQAKLDNLKAAKETVNLIIGYKRFQQEIAENNARKEELKVKSIYDSDDEGEGEYTVERFKKDLNRVGKKEKNDEDKEYVVREYHIGVNSRKANTSVNVAFMQTGEMFGSFGTITKPINEDGILVTEDDYGYKYFIKVLNIENKPSLYRGELCY